MLDLKSVVATILIAVAGGAAGSYATHMAMSPMPLPPPKQGAAAAPQPAPARTADEMARLERFGPETREHGHWKVTCYRDRLYHWGNCSIHAQLNRIDTTIEAGQLRLDLPANGKVKLMISGRNMRNEGVFFRMDEGKLHQFTSCSVGGCSIEFEPSSAILTEFLSAKSLVTKLGDSTVEAAIGDAQSAISDYWSRVSRWQKVQ